jgi:hypothetical protein
MRCTCPSFQLLDQELVSGDPIGLVSLAQGRLSVSIHFSGISFEETTVLIEKRVVKVL